MNSHRNRALLILMVFLATSASSLRAAVVVLPPGAPIRPVGAFFDSTPFFGFDRSGSPIYYLNYFGAFTYEADSPNYIYKFDFGWLYDFGGTTSTSADVYLYDFQTDDTFYTATNLYPYLYSFSKGTYLYYFEGSMPREFYNFSTNSFENYPFVYISN